MSKQSSHQRSWYQERILWQFCSHWYTFIQILVFSWICVPQNPFLVLPLLLLFQVFSLPAARYQMLQDWKNSYSVYYPRLLAWLFPQKVQANIKYYCFLGLFVLLTGLVFVYASVIFLNAVAGFHALLAQVSAMRWMTWALSFILLLPGFVFALMNTGADALMYVFYPLLETQWSIQLDRVRQYWEAHPYALMMHVVLASTLGYASLHIAGHIGLMWVTGAQKCLMASGLWLGAGALTPSGLMLFFRITLAFDFVKRVVNLLGIHRESLVVQTYKQVVRLSQTSRFMPLFFATNALVTLFRSLMAIKTMTILGGASTWGFSGVVANLLSSELRQYCRFVGYYAEPNGVHELPAVHQEVGHR